MQSSKSFPLDENASGTPQSQAEAPIGSLSRRLSSPAGSPSARAQPSRP